MKKKYDMKPKKILVASLIFISVLSYGQSENYKDLSGINISPELVQIINDYTRESDSRFMSFDAKSLQDKCLHDYFLNPKTKIYNDIYQTDRLEELISLLEYHERYANFGSNHPQSLITNFNFLSASSMGKGELYSFELFKENEYSGLNSDQVEKNLYTRYFAYRFPNGTTRIIKTSKSCYLLDKHNPLKKWFVPNIILTYNTQIKGNQITSSTHFSNTPAFDLELQFPVIGKTGNYLSVLAGIGHNSSDIYSEVAWNGSKTFSMKDKDMADYLLDVSLDGNIIDNLSYSQLYFPVGLSYTKSFFQLAWQKNRPGLPFQFEFHIGLVPTLISGIKHKVTGDSITTRGIYSIENEADFIMDNDAEYGFGKVAFNERVSNTATNMNSFYLNSFADAKIYVPITRDVRFFIGGKYNYSLSSPFNVSTADFVAEVKPTTDNQVVYTYQSNHNNLIDNRVTDGFSIEAGVKLILTDHFNNVGRRDLILPDFENEFYYSSISIAGLQSYGIKIKKEEFATLQYKNVKSNEWLPLTSERIETPSIDSIVFRKPFGYEVIINNGSPEKTTEFNLTRSHLSNEIINIGFEKKMVKVPAGKPKKVQVNVDSDSKNKIGVEVTDPFKKVITKGAIKNGINKLNIKIPETDYLDCYNLSFKSPFGYRLVPESFKSAFVEHANELTCNLAFINTELGFNNLSFRLEPVNTVELIVYIPTYTNYFLDSVKDDNRSLYKNSVLNQIQRLEENADKRGTNTYIIVQNKVGVFEQYDVDRLRLNDVISETDVLSVFDDFKKIITEQIDPNILNTKIRKVNVHIVYLDANCYKMDDGNFEIFDNYDSSSSAFLQKFYASLYDLDPKREHFNFTIHLKKDLRFNEKSYRKQIFEYPFSINFF